MMNRHEREGTTDAKEYQDGLMLFYTKHILNLEVWPEDATKSLMAMNENPTLQGDVRALAIILAPRAMQFPNSPLCTIPQARHQ